ncbi:hypothetical protein AB6T38_08820 [Aliiglaciecola sp. SL4]|uniref:hypothetical protein n=1 Tax=Aliiglaciecola sp. SL4 TaxID=3239806 RepID=UPI00355B6026
MNFRLFFIPIVIFLGGCVGTSHTSSILYNIGPVEEGAFSSIDILLDIDSQTYKTPHNDGYGVYRFDGTNICFLASYSKVERCIDFQIEPAKWVEGEHWEIKSFDGSDAVVTVKEII